MEALQDINFVGSICSILGLLISIGVLIYSYIINSKLAALRGKILRNENLPNLLEDLKQHKKELLDYYEKFDNSTDQIKLKINDIRVTVESLMLHLESNERRNCKTLINDILKINNKYELVAEKNRQSFKNDVWNVYIIASGLAKSIEYYLMNIIKFDNYA